MDIITLLDEAIQSHTGGSADANLCADKFLCQLLSDGEENISPSNNTLRSFLWKKLRYYTTVAKNCLWTCFSAKDTINGLLYIQLMISDYNE